MGSGSGNGGGEFAFAVESSDSIVSAIKYIVRLMEGLFDGCNYQYVRRSSRGEVDDDGEDQARSQWVGLAL